VHFVTTSVIPHCVRVERSIVRRRGGWVVLHPKGPRSCPSYVVSRRHHLIDPIRPTIDPVEFETVRLIFQLYLHGDGKSGALRVKEIVKWLNARCYRTRRGKTPSTSF
jgi:hypothetical protein